MVGVVRVRRVLLVDDHPVFREGLCAVINSHPSLTVVAEAASVTEGMEKFRLCAPDLFMTDLSLGAGSGHDLITPRKADVMTLLCAGESPRDIGQSLCLSLSTVKTHMRNIYRKLGVANRAQLLLRSMEMKGHAGA